jgi:murein DD-endopeptidase MepM/ murein hydrolase activator NlpD
MFSPTGDRFAVGNSNSLELIELPTGNVTTLPGGWEIALSREQNLTAVTDPNRLQLFRGAIQTADLKTAIPLPRRIVFSPENEIVVVAGRSRLEIFDVRTNALLGAASLNDGRTFRDLRCSDNKVLAGVQQRKDAVSSGFLQVYSRQGELLEEYCGDTRSVPHALEVAEARNVSRQRETIPWPFFPFDSMRTVWNHYEQHMGGWGVEYSYLHQGLDLIIPIAEPVYAVESGIVKCVLTLGGAVYWRTAVSPVQESGWSTGWLYAHLIESSIQVDIGDTVQIHDYLGDIIQWGEDWGHIHFAEIVDTGLVWQYDDNEWGITRNPLPLLDPLPDMSAPVFEDVFPGSRFAFCRNNASHYLDPDDLNGAVDVIVKVYDLAGPSPWQQPANTLYYWIERVADGELVVPRTLSQVLGHPYPFYSGDNYEPWATLFYQRDELLQPSSWGDTTRNYHQILTNNNGDSLALLSEKDLALETTSFQNGLYHIFAEAQDDNGNVALDSMEVYFNNPGNDWGPEIVGLWIIDGTLYIDWGEVPAANGYTMYSSLQPYSGFTIDSSGIYEGSSWHTELDTDAVRYYRVTAEIP